MKIGRDHEHLIVSDYIIISRRFDYSASDVTEKCMYDQGAGVFSTSVEPKCSVSCSFPSTQPFMNSNHHVRDSQQVANCSRAEPCHGISQPVLAQPTPIMRGTTVSLAKEHKVRSDLQGLVLTLGGPASGNHA